ncbi:MAG: hypothetical protein ACO4BJ_09790 [Planctomycetota bacterium]
MSPPVLLSPLLLLVLSLGAPGVAVGTIDEGSRPGASLGSATTAQIGDRQIEVRPRLLHGILVDGAREVRINRPGVNLVLEQGEHPPTGTADPGPLPRERWIAVDRWLERQGLNPAHTITPQSWPELRWIRSGRGWTPALGHRIHWTGTASAPPRELELWVGADRGEVLEVRDLLREGGTAITAQGRIPVDGRPFAPSTPLVTHPLPDLRVLPLGYPIVHTDEIGIALIPGVSGSVTATINLVGTHADVMNQGAADTDFTLTVPAGGVETATFGIVADEFSIAEAAGYIVPSLARAWVRGLAPGLAAADAPVSVHVNVAGTCFAGYLPIFQTIQCTRAGGGCANAAYGTLLAHEWFHHLDGQLPGSSELEVQEANADIFAAYLFGDPRIGRDYQGIGFHLRDLTAPAVYPIPSASPHESGRPLSAAFWDLRQLLAAELGPVNGPLAAAELWLTWVIGGSGDLDRGTLQELLELDDDDGDLSNGTPHGEALLAAFLPHGLGIPLVAVPSFACARDEQDVHLTWTLPAISAHGAIEVLRDGSVIETLPPDATSTIDLAPPSGFHEWSIVLRQGPSTASSPICLLEIPEIVTFIRGDISMDGGLDISDPIQLLDALFAGGPPIPCLDAGDIDDNGRLDLADPVLLLTYLFQAGAAPAAPFPDPGLDPTPDTLLCL